MALPAVQLGPMLAPATTGVTPPVDGDDDFAALVPIDEPLSAGEPPIAPALIVSASKQYPARIMRSVAGYPHSAPLGTDARATGTLQWNEIDGGARGDVLDWLASVTGGANGAAGITVRPDGPEGPELIVRPTAEPVTTQTARDVFTVTLAVEVVMVE